MEQQAKALRAQHAEEIESLKATHLEAIKAAERDGAEALNRRVEQLAEERRSAEARLRDDADRLLAQVGAPPDGTWPCSLRRRRLCPAVCRLTMWCLVAFRTQPQAEERMSRARAGLEAEAARLEEEVRRAPPASS